MPSSLDFGRDERTFLDLQRSKAGATGVILQGDGAPNTAMIPSPMNLSTVPP